MYNNREVFYREEHFFSSKAFIPTYVLNFYVGKQQNKEKELKFMSSHILMRFTIDLAEIYWNHGLFFQNFWIACRQTDHIKHHILEFRFFKKPLNVSKNVFLLILIKKIESFIAYLSLFNIILRYFKELIFTQIYFFFSRINWRFGFVIICKVFLFLWEYHFGNAVCSKQPFVVKIMDQVEKMQQPHVQFYKWLRQILHGSPIFLREVLLSVLNQKFNAFWNPTWHSKRRK
jgi:hypothetical protein